MTTIVFFLLFILPLIVLPVTVSPFEAPKVILAEILIELLAFTIILRSRTVWSGRGFTLKSIINLKIIPLLTLFILTIVHLIFFSTQTTFFGNPFRLQGVFLLWHLIIFSIISNNIKLDHLPKYFYIISILGLLIGTLVLGGNESRRAFGTLGEPNALSAVALFIWPFSFFYPIYQTRSAKFISPILTFIIILLSGSRSGLLAFGIQSIFLTLTSLQSHSRTGKVTIICLILLSFSLVLPAIEGGGWFENRSEVWKTALVAGAKSPIIGSGFGNMEFSLKDTSKLLNNNIQYQYVDSSHNFLLDYWIQGGILGLGALTSILYLSLLTLSRKSNRLLLCSFLGILTVMSFNPVSIVTLLAFWYLVGQGLKES